MMKTKPKAAGMFSGSTATGGGGKIRPGGMLVQRRNSDSDQTSIPIPTIKVKVKYGSSFLEFNISSQATFGELKKMLAGPTGLNYQDQKLIFKDKERESKTYLVVAGVKDGSKILLIKNIESRERLSLELLKNAKMDKASMEISEISLEVDKFAKQVANLESEICGGKKVVERVLLNLIEDLMRQLIKLDGIVADGDVKLKRRMQVKRVQKYIEVLDMLKIKNSSNGTGAIKIPLQKIATGEMPKSSVQKHQEQRRQSNPVVVATNWEKFDSAMTAKSLYSISASPIKNNINAASYKQSWEYFV